MAHLLLPEGPRVLLPGLDYLVGDDLQELVQLAAAASGGGVYGVRAVLATGEARGAKSEERSAANIYGTWPYVMNNDNTVVHKQLDIDAYVPNDFSS